MVQKPRGSEGQSRSSWGGKAGRTATRAKVWGMGHTKPNKKPWHAWFSGKRDEADVPAAKRSRTCPPAPPRPTPPHPTPRMVAGHPCPALGSGKDVEMICHLSLSWGISLPNWVSLVWSSHSDKLKRWRCLPSSGGGSAEAVGTQQRATESLQAAWTGP